MSAQTIEKYRIIAQIPSGYVLMHKETNEVAVYKTVSSPLDYQNQKKLLQERQKIQHENLLKIIDFAILESNQIETKSSLIYEGWNKDLEEDIIERMKTQHFFTESQLENLIVGSLSGISALHKYDLVHGDIKSNNIAYSEGDDIQIKLIDQFGFGDLYFKSKSQITFEKTSNLAPEIIEFSDDNQYEFYATKANDVFALGVVFLEAATLNFCKNLYDWDSQKFNYQQLEKYQKIVNQNYGPNIQKAISLMCETNPTLRADSFSILELFKPHQNFHNALFYSQNGLEINQLNSTLQPAITQNTLQDTQENQQSISNFQLQESQKNCYINVINNHKMNNYLQQQEMSPQFYDNGQTNNNNIINNRLNAIGNFNISSLKQSKNVDQNNKILQNSQQQNQNLSNQSWQISSNVSNNNFNSNNNYNNNSFKLNILNQEENCSNIKQQNPNSFIYHDKENVICEIGNNYQQILSQYQQQNKGKEQFQKQEKNNEKLLSQVSEKGKSQTQTSLPEIMKLSNMLDQCLQETRQLIDQNQIRKKQHQQLPQSLGLSVLNSHNNQNNKNYNELLNDSDLSGLTTANGTHTDIRNKIIETNKNNKIMNDNSNKPLKNSAVMKLNFDNIQVLDQHKQDGNIQDSTYPDSPVNILKCQQNLQNKSMKKQQDLANNQQRNQDQFQQQQQQFNVKEIIKQQQQLDNQKIAEKSNNKQMKINQNHLDTKEIQCIENVDITGLSQRDITHRVCSNINWNWCFLGEIE